MADRVINVRVRLRRPEGSQPPATLLYGEPAFVAETGDLYVGGPDEVPVLLSGAAQRGEPGPKGDPGEPGPKGDPGIQGPPGDSITHVGFSPPTDPSKLLWIQIDGSGNIVERWQISASGDWVSQQVFRISNYFDSLTGGSKKTRHSTPCFADRILLESVMARGKSNANFQSGDRWDCNVSLINEASQEVPTWGLSVTGLANGQTFIISESVNLVMPWTDALGVWHRITRAGRSTKIRFFTFSSHYRRVYAETDG